MKQIEKQWRESVKVKESEFIKEVVNDNPDWVRGRRLEFLKTKLKQLKIDKQAIQKTIAQSTAEGIEWFNEVIFDLKGRECEKEIKLTEKEINIWEEEIRNKGQFNSTQIEDARNADCSLFVKIVRSDYKRKWASCPFHEEKTPSFCCYEAGKGFFCYGCSTGGNAIDLVMKIQNLDFKQAVQFILTII